MDRSCVFADALDLPQDKLLPMIIYLHAVSLL